MPLFETVRRRRKAAQGLEYGSGEWAEAVSKASAESAKAFRIAEMQMAATREAAKRKRDALLGALFAAEDNELVETAPPATTEAALDVLFNSGYDVDTNADKFALLSETDRARMNGKAREVALAMRRDGESAELLLRRAALLVAIGESALARKDYERVLELDSTNPEAQKYFNLANYGTAFDPYEVLGVPRDADAEVISLAFRRLAKQWHPDRWVGATEAVRREAETRFKTLNLAQGVLTDAAKRRKYDAGTASVADLMIGWWEKATARWGRRSSGSTSRRLAG